MQNQRTIANPALARWRCHWALVSAVGYGALGVGLPGCAKTDDEVGDRMAAVEGEYGEPSTEGKAGGGDSAGVQTSVLNTTDPPDDPRVDGNPIPGDPPVTTTAGHSPGAATHVPATSSAAATTEPRNGVASGDRPGQQVACGGRAGDTCREGQYCAYAAGQHCGAADAEATCEPRPTGCTREYAPVCGCDGKTYGNACSAAAAGTGVLDDGECPTASDCEQVQCLRAVHCAATCGGEIVQSGCCPCPDGMVDVEIDCKACGGFAGPTCDPETEYCAYEAGKGACGVLDVSAVCKRRPDVCTQEIAPVCGCDGKTYTNECAANAAGTGVSSDGACEG